MNRDGDYLWDRSGDDPEVAALEQLLTRFAHEEPLRAPPPRRRKAIAVGVAVAVTAAAAVAIVLGRWTDSDRPTPGETAATAAESGAAPMAEAFPFRVRGGRARLGESLADAGALRVGAWLETAAGAVADIEIADIGALELQPGSRLRLVGTGPDQHRLELARGRLSARVVAPPRLFVVDTPVATAFDLGCAYDMEVDAEGRTHVHVTSGAVSLEGHGRAAWVPRGFAVVAIPGRGPGTPVSGAAAPALRDALARFDAGDGAAGHRLARILALATERDSATLWNLLLRTDGADRVAVLTRLEQLAPRPASAPREDVLAGRPQAIEEWRRSLDDAILFDP